MLVVAFVLLGLYSVHGSPTVQPVRCLVNGTYYNAGEKFQRDPCSPCYCGANGQPICAVTDCFFTPCVNPVQDPTKCCPTCPDGPNCRVGNVTISAGKDHVIGDQICSCALGFGGGNQALCLPNGCTYHGKQYPVGSFRPSPCKHCQCGHTGHAICAVTDCFFSECVDAVHKPDVCCPVCPNGPNCYVGNKIIPAGKDYNDGHQVCRCADGGNHFGHTGQQAICFITHTTASAVLQ